MAEISQPSFRNFSPPVRFLPVEILKGLSDPAEVIGSEAGG
jgi:hypothetical protein